MKSRYQSKYSAYSPNHEPRTAFGQMRKKMQGGEKQNVRSYDLEKCVKDVYEVNHEILNDMQNVYQSNVLCTNQKQMINVILRLKKGLKKMKERAKTINLDEDTQITGEADGDNIKKQIVLELKNARGLIDTLVKFGTENK